MTSADSTPTAIVLAPRLIVSNGDDALSFYASAFNTEPYDHAYDGDRLVNAHVRFGDTELGVTQEDGGHNHAPTTLGGSPVAISLTVPNVDAVAERFVAAGGEVIIAIDDRPYGRRDGRLVDPFGHLWIIGQPLG